MTWKFYQNDRNGRKWLLIVIKDTADICCFYKKWYVTAQEYLLSKLPLVSLKQIEKLLHFSFKAVEHFSDSKPQPLDKESWAKTREKVGIPRSCWGRGDGQAWNWLIHKESFVSQVFNMSLKSIFVSAEGHILIILSSSIFEKYESFRINSDMTLWIPHKCFGPA